MDQNNQKQEPNQPKVEMIGDVKVIRFDWVDEEEDEWVEAYKAFKRGGRIRGCGK